MSCEQRREITLFLFVATLYFHTFQVCHSVSVAQRADDLSVYQVEESQHDSDAQQGSWRLVEQVILSPNVRSTQQPGLKNLQPKSAASPGEPLPYPSAPTLHDTGGNFNSLPWTTGIINRQPKSSASASEDGYQADFTDFDGVQGKILGPSFDSNPHFSEWLALKPLVQCDDDVMTFTASGEGLTHLLVDREGASPISPFQLPSDCGYSVRTSWSDLEMMVPYDACYITQENGSYVLPMLWWGNPLNLSCPVKTSTPAPPLAPSVFCSPYGMAVQINGQEQDIAMLGVIVNGVWGPFVSEDCAYPVYSNAGEFIFFISNIAPCITAGDGLRLQLILDVQEYILSCPVNPQFPNGPHSPSSPLSPGDPKFPYIPAPVDPVPTSPPPPPPQPPTQEQIAQLPEYHHYPYPGFQYPQLPQAYPPGPQPVHPPVPRPDSPPGFQQPQQQPHQPQQQPHQPQQQPHQPQQQPQQPQQQQQPQQPQQQPQQPQQQLQQQYLFSTWSGKLPYSPEYHPKYPYPYPGFQYSQFPQVYSTGPQPVHPHIPDPVDPVPPSPPQPPTQEQIAQLPEYHYYPYPGLFQVYSPGPQPAHPPVPKPGSPLGLQQQQSHFPTWPGKLPYFPEDHPKYPYPGFQYPQLPQVYFPDPKPVPKPGSPPGPQQPQQPQQSLLPMWSDNLPYSPEDHPKYPYPVVPSPNLSPAQNVHDAVQPPKLPVNPYYPQYYLQMPYYPAPTAAPVTQALFSPSPPSPPAPPKKPLNPEYPVGPFYPPTYYNFPYPQPSLEVLPAATSHPTIAPPMTTTTTTTRTMIPKQPDSYPFNPLHPQRPVDFLPLTPLPAAKEKPQTIVQESQKPVAPQATCPYTHTICSYYPYPYYPYYHSLFPPYYHPPYLPVPQYPSMTTEKPFSTPTTTTTAPATTTSTASAPTVPTPQVPHLQCLMGRMVAFLPFAHPDSIQVRDRTKTWLYLSSVSPLCGYTIQMAEDSRVILHSPLPACHSEPRTPTTTSLPLRFWDFSMAQYRTLDLQCPYQSIPETPAPVTSSVSPTQPRPSKGKVREKSVVSKPKVFCSSHQMDVELPTGPVSGIVLKDIKGNQMNLQDAPKHCGYSARKGKDGKILLSLQLQSRCHMSVQGKTYIISVVYTTVSGRREAQFFCPVLILRSGQECNLPSEQRLPCGLGSVSQPQCLSMGCCFSKQPPACYYPMDECTIDRHFVFSVPASLTEPPLSPALLVAAGDSTCKPQRVTSDYALFKIPMDGCGTRRIMVGKTVIYMVEVVNKVQAISLNYGTITRDSPVRLLVECRYLPSTVLSVSYMVKTPTLGPAVQTQGVFGVQLRIAKDAQYSSYYPQYHQPLQMLLGKPLYLEVRLLNTPDPSLVLLVHFCVAYPRSGTAVWLLLYNGCPNPLDPAPQQAVLVVPQPPAPQAQTRRFTISTFQFLPDGEFKDPDEEIYFMCSTEICSPRDGPCVEGCFGQ